jgi:hypothetical protein
MTSFSIAPKILEVVAANEGCGHVGRYAVFQSFHGVGGIAKIPL